MPTAGRLAALVCAFLLAACAAGRPFTRPSDDQLVFGSTTKSQVLALMGTPIGRGQKVSNGASIEILTYAFARVGDRAAFEGVTPARAYAFLFHRDVLVGREFNSSFHADSTYFDPERAMAVKEGMRREEVVALLGKASGEYRYPVIANPQGRAMGYLYTQTRTMKASHLLLVVELDESDIVRKVEFTRTGID